MRMEKETCDEYEEKIMEGRGQELETFSVAWLYKRFRKTFIEDTGDLDKLRSCI